MNLNDLFTEEKVRLDPKCWTGKKIGNPKTKMKGGTRVNNCVPAESVNEMDKSQTPPGRDGGDSDAGKKEYTAKATTAKKVAKDAEKILNKELNKKQGVAEGSGFDQEAGIGIDGKSFKFKIRDLVALADNYPVTKIDPQQFSKQIAGRDEDSTQSMARAEKADLQYPIIVVKRQNGQLWIADGTHRAHKAIMHKLPSINAKIIPIKDMAPFDVDQGVAEGFSNAVTFFRGEPILSQERLNQLKSSIGKPYPILRKEGSAANIGTYMSPDGDKATSFVKQALAGQGKGGVVTQIQVNPNSFSKGDGGIDEAVIITNIAGLVSNQTPNKNDPLRIQDRKQAMLKYLGPGVKKYLNDPLLSDPKIVQSWYNPEFAQKNWNTINSGKQAVTKPGESNMQERMMRILGPLAENIRRDPQVINYFISHNPGDWVEYNFRMNSDGSGTKVVDVKYYPPAKQGVAEGRDDKAEAYRAHLIKTLPQIMKLFANVGKGWIPSKEQMLSAVDNAYQVIKHTGDVKQAGKALMDELNTLHRMSQGQQDVNENFADGRNPQDKYGVLLIGIL